MKHFFFATLLEAQPFIDSLDLNISQNKRAVYCSEKVSVIITGVGILQASQTVAVYLNELKMFSTDEFFNVGIAAAINPKLHLNEVYEIGEVYIYDYFMQRNTISNPLFETLFPTLKQSYSELNLFSSLHPVWNNEEKELLQKNHCDLLDMEGYAIAQTAMKFDVPLKIFKIVSDFAKRNNEVEFAESAKQTALHLTQWLGKIV